MVLERAVRVLVSCLQVRVVIELNSEQSGELQESSIHGNDPHPA